MIRIVVADDQEIVRDGLVVLLDLIEGIEVVGQAADGEAAVREVAATRPDIVLMDLRMPVLDGTGATRRIAADYPGVAVLVLTTFADDESISDSLRAGARGYLTKDAGRTQLEAAIRSVASGQTALSAEVSQRLISRFDDAARAEEDPPDPALKLRERFPELTRREAEVLALITTGTPNPRIAELLFISVATVKTHVNAIFTKLGASTRAEVIAITRTPD